MAKKSTKKISAKKARKVRESLDMMFIRRNPNRFKVMRRPRVCTVCMKTITESRDHQIITKGTGNFSETLGLVCEDCLPEVKKFFSEPQSTNCSVCGTKHLPGECPWALKERP